jgi:two-component system alkaline phosphatase synthesis response regulator PhoP
MQARPRPVLIVDDEPSLRFLCRVNLELAGLSVIEASDGESALELARSERPSVILLDVRLPNGDGWHVADELLRDVDTAQIPVVFVSARWDSGRGRRPDRAAGYVTKPFDPVRLAALIERLAARAS